VSPPLAVSRDFVPGWWGLLFWDILNIGKFIF